MTSSKNLRDFHTRHSACLRLPTFLLTAAAAKCQAVQVACHKSPLTTVCTHLLLLASRAAYCDLCCCASSSPREGDVHTVHCCSFLLAWLAACKLQTASSLSTQVTVVTANCFEQPQHLTTAWLMQTSGQFEGAKICLCTVAAMYLQVGRQAVQLLLDRQQDLCCQTRLLVDQSLGCTCVKLHSQLVQSGLQATKQSQACDHRCWDKVQLQARS